MSGYVTPVLVTNPRDYIPEQKARDQAYILENIREYECALDSLYSKRNSRIMCTGQPHIHIHTRDVGARARASAPLGEW